MIWDMQARLEALDMRMAMLAAEIDDVELILDVEVPPGFVLMCPDDPAEALFGYVEARARALEAGDALCLSARVRDGLLLAMIEDTAGTANPPADASGRRKSGLLGLIGRRKANAPTVADDRHWSRTLGGLALSQPVADPDSGEHAGWRHVIALPVDQLRAA